jgi:ATP-dependent RNA helicase DDX52/ROK1
MASHVYIKTFVSYDLATLLSTPIYSKYSLITHADEESKPEKPAPKTKKDKRRQREKAGEAGEAPQVAVFKEEGLNHASEFNFTDTEPRVNTRDPFEEANIIRKSHRIKVSGAAPPAPLRSFNELQILHNVSPRLLMNLADGGFTEPTPIQRQAIPSLLTRRELLAVAPTGSGKTLAFLLPLVMHVRSLLAKSEEQQLSPGVKGLVLSPTKELSVQTGRVLKTLLPSLRLRCSVLSKSTAAGTDFSKVDILLANPLRLGGMVREGKIDLTQVQTLILDEADKLFDLGFAEQVDAVVAACTHPEIVRGLFSATLPETVEGLARSVLRDPLRITVGERGAAAASVDQKLLFVGQENGKLLALRQLISEGLRPPILVFVNTKERARELHRELMYDGVHVDSLHAAQSAASRSTAVDNFRSGKTWVLVATDLVGRGMDFIGVNTVINFDFPRSTTDYVHRVGRTGRAGRQGDAVTFFTEDDVGQLRAVANVMRSAGCEVAEWMLGLKKDRNFNRDRRERSESGAVEGVTTDPERAKRLKRKAQEGKKRGGNEGLKKKKKPQSK